MPDFEVTSPDGRKFIVTAPEGASQAEIIDYAKQNLPAATRTPNPDAQPIGMFGRFMQGVGDLPTGARQFMANVLPEGMKPTLNLGAKVGEYIPAVGLAARMLGDIQGADEANQGVTARENTYQDRLKASGVDGMDWARIGGQAASTLPAMMIPGAQTYLGAAGLGAATGAATSGLSPVPNVQDDYGQRAAMNAGIGGVAGAAGGVAGKMLGGLIAPRIDPNVRALADAGVELTPGQIVGGTARRVEDAATSIPIVGTGIANAQRRSLESFNRSVADEVLSPIGGSVPRGTPAGRALMNQVDDAIGAAYTAAHARVRPFAPDAQFVNDFAALRSVNTLFRDQAGYFRQFFTNQIMPELSAGPLDGATAQRISSMLKHEARQFSSSQTVAEQKLGQAFKDTVNLFDNLVARTNPSVAPDIKKANAAFARMIRMESASAGAGATDGVFTAPQFSAAVRRTDMSPRKGEFARGNALMQGLSDPAKAVLPSTVPDSGTGMRGMLGATGGAIASGMVDPSLMAAYLGATAAGRVAYSEPATRAFRAMMLARRPEFMGLLGEGVRRAGQSAGYPTRGLLAEGMR